MWITMGQYRKVIDKTERFVTGEWKIDAQGYAHVLILKAYAYHGTNYFPALNTPPVQHLTLR
jgi:hypothetical protein